MNKEKKKINLGKKRIKKEYVIVIALCLIAFYFVFSSFKGIFKSSTNKSVQNATYQEEMEKKLSSALSDVRGLSNVNVKISFAGSVKSVIATEKTTTQNGTEIKTVEKPILVGGKTVLLEEINPQIVGVIIVAHGVDNLSVRANVLNAVVTFLGYMLV